MKFEIGKIYVDAHAQYKCIWITPMGHPVMVDVQTGTNEFISWAERRFKEYKESRTLKKYMNIWENISTKIVVFDHNLYETKELADGANYGTYWKRIDTIEINWTEKV